MPVFSVSGTAEYIISMALYHDIMTGLDKYLMVKINLPLWLIDVSRDPRGQRASN